MSHAPTSAHGISGFSFSQPSRLSNLMVYSQLPTDFTGDHLLQEAITASTPIVLLQTAYHCRPPNEKNHMDWHWGPDRSQ